ncbi:MbnP family protein [Bizionia sediminis]|uniref:MbnP family protein n=1 Tax=Bizionia sediminis TaxID=1737064 RepID=A0ABW5KS57_9FLAO
MKHILTITCIAVLLLSCSTDQDDNLDPGKAPVAITFQFTHNWDDVLVTNSSINNSIFTNAHGETMTITRLRYLISGFQLIHENGTTYNFDGYKFTDLSTPESYNFTPQSNSIPKGRYTLKFIWGFNADTNLDGAYPELNSASWNWPAMLGGGYHFLQMDGMYNVNTMAKPYNFHNGTARVSAGVFEQNFAEITLNTPITITNSGLISVNMNLAEFFKNPNTWNLNNLDTNLMPNYQAQKMMQANVQSVFSLGTNTP